MRAWAVISTWILGEERVSPAKRTVGTEDQTLDLLAISQPMNLCLRFEYAVKTNMAFFFLNCSLQSYRNFLCCCILVCDLLN